MSQTFGLLGLVPIGTMPYLLSMKTTQDTGSETMITRITLDPAQYDERQTIGGGTVRDLMPFEGAVSYVTDGEQYGIEYEDGQIDWLGLTLSQAFGDGVEILSRSEV